jgi:hypothetical protein
MTPRFGRASLFLAVFAVTAGFFAPIRAKEPEAASGPPISDIHVKALPVVLDPDHPADVNVGKLTYVAGYELVADDRRFGGLSSLIITPNGSDVTAISDRGFWVWMQLKHDGDKVTGIGDAKLGVLGNRSVFPLRKIEADSESLALDQDGSYLVGFEEIHRIWRYSPTPDRPGPEAMSGTPSVVRTPGLLQRAHDNQSLESLTVLPDGRIFTALEDPIPGERENHAWLIDKNQQAEDLYYDAKNGYSPTDFTVLPSGDVMVVERYFKPLFDIRARFRILKLADIKPGAHLDGKLIAEIKSPLTIDNMEGLASRKAADGSTLIYVISDDNYSALQRTLLLEFRLDKDAD